MNRIWNPTKSVISAFALLGAATAMTAAMAADLPAHIRGTIVAATPENLTVRTNEGSVSVAFDAATRISGVVPSRTRGGRGSAT